MREVSIILMVITILVSLKISLKVDKSVTHKEIPERSLLISIFALMGLWAVFSAFSLDFSFFWRGVSAGVLLWLTRRIFLKFEQKGDIYRLLNEEICIAVVASCLCSILFFILNLNWVFYAFSFVLLPLGIILWYLLQNQKRKISYKKQLDSEYAIHRRKNTFQRMECEISKITDKKILQREIVKTKQRLLLSGKKCDLGNCLHSRGCCLYQQSVKLQSCDYVRGCELDRERLRMLEEKLNGTL